MVNWEDILAPFGVKEEDLTQEEHDIAMGWYKRMIQEPPTVSDIREYVSGMKSAVEMEACKPDITERHKERCLARLENLLMLEAFLSSQEKAKRQIERMMREKAGR